MPIRASALRIAEHCLLAERLAAEFPHDSAEAIAGRAADDEACADLLGGPPATNPDAIALAWWVRKNLPPVETGETAIQRPVELKDPDTGELLVPGRPDVLSVVYEALDGRTIEPVVVVVDFKSKGQYYNGLPHPDENPQTHAYGLAVSAGRPYRVCLLLFDDGTVSELWSRTYTAAEQRPILDRIRRICGKKAALGDIRPVGHSGPHCEGCYQRRNCSSWLLPSTHVETALAPLATPGGLTHDNFESVYLAWRKGQELMERVEVMLKHFTAENGPGRIGDKEWGPELQRGRKSVSVEAVEGAGLQHLVRQGEPKMVFRLRNRR